MIWEGMRKLLSVRTPLGFISIDGIYRACGYEGRNNKQPQFTDHCFTGDYPTRLKDLEASENHRALGLLVD